ncbi:hypothetical protein ACFP63_16175 [Oerskovia jenensis]|uniref:Uncharacterized protein n=1 Tax=Oerskovia jenensis TaxID=162169 RepID=A0ABS2LFQ0_9CELL|nr:hypothetical protein [Oerskovia jenensis]MBM7478664.1 hypothetical protein [Oerskovia jenensis]
MTRRDDPMSPRHWAGGFYELALLVGRADDDRLDDRVAALVAAVGLSRLTVVDGTVEARVASEDRAAVRAAGGALVRGAHLRGVVRLPGGGESSCGILLLRGERDDGDARGSGSGLDVVDLDWLVLHLPLAGLDAGGVEVDGFPFDDRSGAESLTWRRPLDEWLAGVGRSVHRTVPFRRAVIGFEVAGDGDGVDGPDRLAPAAPRDRAHLVVGPAGLTYVAAEH